MSLFDTVFKLLIGHEGGYVNDPKDRGGETKFGISRRSYPGENIPAMTLGRASEIYHRDYWLPIQGDQLPPSIALVVFDAAVNSGVRQSVRWLQIAVDAKPDGIIGPKTLAAVRSSDPVELATELLTMRLAFMDGLPTFSTHGRGWRRRIIGLAQQASRMGTASYG